MVLKGKITDICSTLSKISNECKKVGITDLKTCELLLRGYFYYGKQCRKR